MVKVIHGGVTLGALSLARQGFVDNIDNANLKTIADISTLTATEIARLDADISSMGTLGFADYHYYANLASSATYTPPAKTDSVLYVASGWIDDTHIHVEFYDGAGWIEAGDTTPVDWAPRVFQDNAQSLRILNDMGSALKMSLTGVAWS